MVASLWASQQPAFRGGGALLPLGSTVVGFGHSKIGQQSSPGRRSYLLTALMSLNGRLRLNGAGGDQGIGGQTANQILARVNNVIGQKPDIVVIQADHNSLNLGSASVIASNDSIDAAIASGSPNTKRVWLTETPSNLYPPGDSTLTAVNNDIVAKAGGNRLAVDTATGFVYGTMTYDNIHPKWTGAEYEGAILANALSSLVAGQTAVQALSDTGVNREHGANVDPLHNAFSTSVGDGTKTGTGAGLITGTVPDKCTIANASTASINIVGIDTFNGLGRITLDITGTGVTEALITFGRLNANGGRCPINLAVGGICEALVGVDLTHTDGVSAPLGLAYASLSSGVSFSLGNYSSADANLGTVPGPIVGRVERTFPQMRQTALTNTIPVYGVRVSGTVNVRIVLYGFTCRLTDLIAHAIPFYMGDDQIHSSAFKAGLNSGATTLAVGANGTFQPGDWAGGGISFTGILERSVDGGTNWTPVVTLSPNWSAWTATGSAGDLIRLTVTATNSMGSAIKQQTITLT